MEKLSVEEIRKRCDELLHINLDESRIPRHLFPANYNLSAGAKTLMINSFLTVLANYGDISEEEFTQLLEHYMIELRKKG